ncbi:MAG: hypothetical protein ACE5IG_03930 [Dehalococcoidia bacterium]
MSRQQSREYETVQPEVGQEQGYLRTYSPYQMYLLTRLERLISLKNSYQADPSREEWLLKAVNRAIYATLRDCIEQGTGEEARAIVRREHQAN